MIKVLHIIHNLNRGGIEKWLISMLHQTPRSECQMDVCCKGANVGSLAELVRQSGAKVLHCPLGPAHIGFARRFQQILTEGEYQILHNHLATYSALPVWLAHHLNIPVITSFHNTYFLDPETQLTRLPILRQLRSIYAKVSINYALDHSDLITGCSHGVIQSLDPDGKKQLGVRSRVLYYGVEIPPPTTAQSQADFRASLGWSKNTPIVLHVGRLIEQKNHAGLLSIFQLILRQVPTAKLLLVGEGPLRKSIESMITERGITHAVRLLGFRDDVSQLMQQCNVFLFPSLYEGFGLVAIEANAAGLPVVGSRIPGLTEAVQEGKTALLHELEDQAGMANSVAGLLKDQHGADAMGKAGLQWVEEHYSTQASSKRLLESYYEFTAKSIH